MEDRTVVRAVFLGILLLSIGLGCHFGIQLDHWVRNVLYYGHSLTFEVWMYYIGLWFIVLGAFTVTATAVWMAVKGLYRRFRTD